MPVITKVIPNLDISNDPSSPVATGQIDLALECSKLYSRNVRQGQTFTLKGVQAALIPSAGGTDDWDSGMSINAKHEYIHTTGHTRKVWNRVFNAWKQQQRGSLSHSPVRYNDFECSWSASEASANRTSTIFSSGVGDDDAEYVTLTGNSTSGADFTLEDLSDSMYDAPTKSLDPFDNSTLKDPKFDNTKLWPDAQRFYVDATSSNILTALDGPNAYSGSMTLQTMYEFPIPLKIMCGLMKYEIYIPLDDTTVQYADTVDLILMYYVSTMKPLVYRPRPRKSKFSYQKGKSKFTRRTSSGKRRKR